VRLFIAVPLPSQVADRAAACLPPALPALRPVRPDLLHVTLAFLGWVADDRLDAAGDAARAAAAKVRPFDLSFDHAGRFPPTGRPKALWLGTGAGTTELTRLAADLTAELRARSFALEGRAFTPHLTLARVRAEASPAESRTVAAAIAALAVPELRVEVDRLAVVRSDLSPTGPRYTTLVEAPIG
jgi:2'-5' RNA ligase